MITGLPSYTDKPPVRCDATCGQGRRRYTIYNGADAIYDSQAEQAAREYAFAQGRIFVDSRITPFLPCVTCKTMLDFSAVEECELVM
jgi:hypothetical protein